MVDRYEIRGKLGQGGLGAVYRAWDTVLKREVAIKRILSDDEGAKREEATRQMEKETGALAALQHPHIVTIFDVGSDEDGPFVVMELLTGQTLDEIITRAPLTWQDFRELSLQIQEALIAAQDLGLVHRDLKPGNIMVNWLPSGRFQAKIVDFGLAKFSPKASQQTVDHSDSVFGSIFYMAPEQFERAALDSRADMYSIGCVYYFSLSGRSPFEGDTGPQVMAAHLQHRVIPLDQLRPDLPAWMTNWVMWHINREPAERPENARESLKTFIQLDVPATQSMSTPAPAPARSGPQVRMPRAIPLTPGRVQPAAITEPLIKTHTAPQPLAPPDGAPPSVHTGPLGAAEPAPEPAVTSFPTPVLPPPYVPPPPTIPPPPHTTAGLGPTAVPSGMPTVRIAGANPTPSRPVPGGIRPTIIVPTKKKGMTSGQKQALTAAIGVVVLVILYFVMVYLSRR